MTEEKRLGGGGELFRGLSPGRPPAELGARVLSVAAEALVMERDLWARLWSSRPARLGWAAAVVLLIGAHLAVTPMMGTAVRPAAGNTVIVRGALDGELEEIVRLPHIDLAALSGLP
jgi:hypothetical protein